MIKINEFECVCVYCVDCRHLESVNNNLGQFVETVPLTPY